MKTFNFIFLILIGYIFLIQLTVDIYIEIIKLIIGMNQIFQESNNQNNNTQSSNNANLDNTKWVDISSRKTENIVFNDFLNCVNQNSYLDEQLKNLIGQKDRVSQEIFCAGEKVYFCESCQLGYHEDSWQYLTRKCEQCKSSNVGVYTLSLTSVQQIKEVITESFTINTDYLFYYRQGNAYYQAGDRQKAIENYNNAIRLNHNFADVYSRRGKAHYNIGDIRAAIDDFIIAILLEPNHVIAKKDLDLAYLKFNDTLQKRKFISTYNSSNIPINADYLFYYRQGNAYYQAGHRQKAIENYNNSICLNSNYSDVYSRRGKAHSDIGNIQAAINDLTIAILIDPNHAIAKRYLKLANSKLKNTYQAREYINVFDLHIIRRNIGQIINVKGKIVSVSIDQDNYITYFDFAQNVLDGFYAYVPVNSFHKFHNPTSYIGSNVAVFARITLDSNNQLCMKLDNDWQLRRIE